MYYLLIKEIEQTGLKYLCKRKYNHNVKDDHLKYKGSGVLWRRILNKHPEYIIKTTVLGLFTKEDLKIQGLYYSDLYNIVEDKQWANLIKELGDGGDTSTTPGYLKAREEGRFKREYIKTNVYYNPLTNIAKKIKVGDTIPEGFIKGNVPGRNYGPSKGVTKVYNNGHVKVYIRQGDQIPDGFEPGVWYSGTTKGRIACHCPITKKKKYVLDESQIPEGWNKGLFPTTGNQLSTPYGKFDSVQECINILNLTRYQINKNIISEPDKWFFNIKEK